MSARRCCITRAVCRDPKVNIWSLTVHSASPERRDRACMHARDVLPGQQKATSLSTRRSSYHHFKSNNWKIMYCLEPCQLYSFVQYNIFIVALNYEKCSVSDKLSNQIVHYFFHALGKLLTTCSYSDQDSHLWADNTGSQNKHKCRRTSLFTNFFKPGTFFNLKINRNVRIRMRFRLNICALNNDIACKGYVYIIMIIGCS